MKNLVFQRAFYVAILFGILYLLSFNGIPISDDEQLFAVTARTIAVQGHFDAAPLYGNVRLQGEYQAEPLHPLLASAWYHIFNLWFANGLQSFFLVSIIYISVAASLLFLLIVHFGYPSNFALEMVFLCAFSTILWPYATTFFREPLLVLLLILSWLSFEKAFQSININNKYLILFIISIVGIAATKIIYALVVLPYLVMAWTKSRNKAVNKFILIFILFIFFALLFFSVRFSEATTFYRYSLPAWQEHWVWIVNLPRESLLLTILATLFSYWKGFFIYSPILLFVFLLPWTRTHLRKKIYLAFLPLSVFFLLFVFQLATYGDNPWTPTWSVRFLVPAIPLLFIATLPALADLYSKPAGKIFIRVVGFIGFVIQINAILVNSSLYTSVLIENSNNYPYSEYWNVLNSPAIHQWRLLLEGHPSNLMILRILQQNAYPLPAYLFLISGFLLITLLFFVLFFYSKKLQRHFIFSLAALGVITMLLFSFIRVHDPFYAELAPLVEQACQIINSSRTESALVVIQPYPSSLWATFANQDCLPGKWYSLPDDDFMYQSTVSVDLIDNLFRNNDVAWDEVWLVRQVQPGSFFTQEHLLDYYQYKQIAITDSPIEFEILRLNKK